MAWVWPGVTIRKFFPVPQDASDVVLHEGDVTITIQGLTALPSGSEYYLTLAATPIHTPEESHQQ